MICGHCDETIKSGDEEACSECGEGPFHPSCLEEHIRLTHELED